MFAQAAASGGSLAVDRGSNSEGNRSCKLPPALLRLSPVPPSALPDVLAVSDKDGLRPVLDWHLVP